MARCPQLRPCRADLTAAAAAMFACAQAGKTMFFCGNGGSCADAEHIVGELLKSFKLPRPLPAAAQEKLRGKFGAAGAYLAANLQGGFRALSLTGHPSFATAMANDVAADLIFAQQVYTLGSPGDLLLGISTSGRAANVLHAARAAGAREMICIGLTGESGGELRELCEVCICAPGEDPARVQELHQAVYHWLCGKLERDHFG